MKFLCDNCKAKYQISDDKVAGKTVRMKCRKCGHQIEVKSEVTETSVSLPPPGAPTAPAAPSPAAGAPRKLATSLSQTKPRPAHSEPPPSTGLAGAFQRSVHDAPVAKEPPSALDLLDMSLTEEWYAAINGVPVGPIRMAELKRKVASGAVTEDSLVWQEGFEEWRPVRTIPELARIVREGQNRPSLATPPPPDARQSTAPPAPSAPQGPTHPPHAGGAPAHPRTEPMHKPAAPMAPSAPMAPQKPAAPLGPLAPLAPAASARPQVAARSNVVPITSRLATAEKLDTEPPERTLALAPGAVPPPAVAPTPQPSPFGPAVPPPPSSSPLLAARDPFAAPAAAASDPLAVAAPSDPFATAVAAPPAHFAPLAPTPVPGMVGEVRERAPSIMAPPPRRGAPWWFILVAIFAGCFGIAVAVILFLNKQQPQQVVIQVPVTGTAPASATAPPPPSSTTVELPEVTASAAPSAKATGPVKPAGTGAAPATTGSAIAGLGDLLKGSSGGTGPTATGGPSGPSGPSTAATFDQSSIERVVNNHKLSVRKQCLERANSDKSSTKVVANITIGPSGNVQSVSASGDDPVAAKCVENQIRGWQFPAPGETKQVQVPFTFVRQ